jgi:hypothetical protein
LQDTVDETGIIGFGFLIGKESEELNFHAPTRKEAAILRIVPIRPIP